MGTCWGQLASTGPTTSHPWGVGAGGGVIRQSVIWLTSPRVLLYTVQRGLEALSPSHPRH